MTWKHSQYMVVILLLASTLLSEVDVLCVFELSTPNETISELHQGDLLAIENSFNSESTSTQSMFHLSHTCQGCVKTQNHTPLNPQATLSEMHMNETLNAFLKQSLLSPPPKFLT